MASPISLTSASTLQNIMSLNSNPSIDKENWLSGIRRIIDEEQEDDDNIPISIFGVPRALLSSDPDSYIPQLLSIGPYHHLRPELYDMMRYKLAATIRVKKQIQSNKFDELIHDLIELESSIRGYYHKYLYFCGQQLAYIMAIDASFLLEFFHICHQGKTPTELFSFAMSHLIDVSGRKSAHDAILRDISMLENQIPMFVLKKILEFQLPLTNQLVDSKLLSMLMSVADDLLPFVEENKKFRIDQHPHLIDFLYHRMVPKVKESVTEEIVVETNPCEPSSEDGGMPFSNQNYVKRLMHEVWNLLLRLRRGRLAQFVILTVVKPIRVILQILNVVQGLFLSGNITKSDDDDTKPPLLEEIIIPPVTELARSGIRFRPTKGGLSTVRFDARTATFYLPMTSLHVSTEVVLRNLVAYEASAASWPLVLTRYTRFMNGIINTAEDVKYLRERGIIKNQLRSDEEVANLWNGMSTSIKITRYGFLDKTIKEVKKYHYSKLKVKASRIFRTYVSGFWEVLTFMAAIFLLLLMSLQAFCSYNWDWRTAQDDKDEVKHGNESNDKDNEKEHSKDVTGVFYAIGEGAGIHAKCTCPSTRWRL
ncbi:Protein of unknown function DUF247, plant [Dillenia turbinata]|uniref:Uncharacterized protein n=1 Tax=Dillenia turbinata TaxID=194707 RepID=A0AAN8YW04_9MAGN